MKDMFDLSGKVAFVTGASSGLGRHMAGTLARAGAKVAIAARRVDRLEALAAEIAGFDGRALPLALDVTQPASVAEAIEEAETELGPLAVLINNAGIASTRLFLEQSEAEWREVLETNLNGAWRVAHEAAKRMAAHGHGGSIVNVTSILGLRPGGHLSAYSAAKAALISLTQALAIELARHKIRVNALAPGYVSTEINREFLVSPAGQAMLKRVPLRRFGETSDLDGSLLLLASDAGRYITGHVLVADGGHSLSFV